MPRKYSHIQEHEKEIIELRSQGMTLRRKRLMKPCT